MEGLWKAAAVAVTGALCAAVLRRGAPELGQLVLLAAGAWILFSLLGALEQILLVMDRLVQAAQLDAAVVEPVAKAVCASIITRITAEVCRGAGEGGLAAFIEVAGTVVALAAALPLVAAVAGLVVEMLA